MAGRIYEHFDIVIVGAGSSGVCAAVAAGQMGARVCLLEKEAAAGGSFVQSGMTAFYPALQARPLPGLEQLCTAAGAYHTVDPSLLQRLYYDSLQTPNHLLLTSAWAMEAQLENGMLTQVIALTREGTLQAEADVFIDASGDGDLAALCAVPYTEGREEDGQALPPYFAFVMEGCRADWEKWQPGEETVAGLGLGGIRLYPGAADGEVTVMLLYSQQASAISAIDRARADCRLRAAVEPVVRLMKGFSAFESSKIHRMGARVVFPEGRHPQGRTILDSQDLSQGTRYGDWVVTGVRAPIELTGMEKVEQEPEILSYDIPYRALTAVRVKNLLLAGRCISGTHRAHGSFRALTVTMATGQAAGVAAALSLENRGKVQKVDVPVLQRRMRELGMQAPARVEEDWMEADIPGIKDQR